MNTPTEAIPPARAPQVLVVAKGPPDTGGIAAFVTDLLRSDLKRSFELRFLNLSRDEVPHAGRFTWRNLQRTIQDAFEVGRSSRGADVVHIHSALVPHSTMFRASLLALAARRRRARVLLHVHNGLVETWLTPRRRRLARALLAPVHVVVTCSEGSRAALAGCLASRQVTLVDNGVEVEKYSRSRSTIHPTPRVLFAGLLTPRKGVLELIEASRLLRARGVEHEVVLVGGTPDEGPEAEGRVRAAARTAGVTLLGPHPHDSMPALYADADVFCLPSWWEAMPLAVLEAMAAGLPVVATDVGDTPRVVLDGTTGLLVPPRRPELLAEALERLLGDEPLRAELGRAGRRRVTEAWDASRTWAALARLYHAASR